MAGFVPNAKAMMPSQTFAAFGVLFASVSFGIVLTSVEILPIVSLHHMPSFLPICLYRTDPLSCVVESGQCMA